MQGDEGEDGYVCEGEAEWKYYSPVGSTEKKRHLLD